MKQISYHVCSICLLLLLFVCGLGQTFAAETRNPEVVSALLNRIGGSGTSDRFVTIVDESLSTDGKDVFVITSQDGKPCVKGNCTLAVTTGINWYLNHYAHVNLAWNNLTTDLTAVSLPVPTQEEKHNCSVDYRYYLNYCTFSYSMSVWTWERWQKEIDWMALHGINMPLQIIGLDVVWKNLLTKDYGYSSAEANNFIAGPCFQGWFGMNNLQGWGGPNPDWWYKRQEGLAKKILARERELGMKPVLPGYAGMVPSDFTSKTGIEANSQGEWCGFTRPYILNPNKAAFAEVSKKYYNRLEELMGTSDYYSIDPFHEGANTSGIDVPAAYEKLASALYDNVNENAKWVVQFWQWSGEQYNILDKVKEGKLIILDLFSEAVPNFGSYKGHESVYCNLPNFGARTGLFGRLNKTLSEFYDYKKKYSGINGVGATPEGIEQVPVLYDALFELPWYASKPDAKKWMSDYTQARYGTENTEAQEAWEKIRNSALNCPTRLQGPHEAVLCARPSLTVGKVSSWGGTDIFYNPQDVVDAAYKMLQAKSSLSGQNYSYDLTDFTRQAFTDYGYYLLKGIKDAANSHDDAAYAKRRDAYLQLILDLDELLNTNQSFMLGRWTNLARAIADEESGTTESDKQWLELDNARTLITTWGGRNNSELAGLRDYSYREWGGMLKGFYYERWKAFFNNRDNGATLPDWFDNDYAWAHNTNLSYSDTPVGNTADVANRLFGKYFIAMTQSDSTPYYMYRYMDNDLSKTKIESALRGSSYTLPIQLPEGITATLGIDFNNDGVISADETSEGLTTNVPADATCSKVKALLTLSDGSTLKFSVVLKDEITTPRTVSVKTANEAEGSVAIEGSNALSVTNTNKVTVKATPAAGYDFTKWTDAKGDVVSTDNPYTYYGKDAADFTANFIVNKWGSPTEDKRELSTVKNYGQYLNSLAISQNGGDEQTIYSATECPGQLFQTATVVKAAKGSQLILHWKSAGGMNYCNLSAYADWNNDGEFNADDELIATEGKKSSADNGQLNDYTLKVLLPYDVPEGITHIRLRFDGAWEDGYDSNGAMPAKNKTTRMVYDIPVNVIAYAETACTVTVKSSDKNKGTVDANGQTETFTYKVGEDVVLRCYPSANYKLDYWADQYGRKVPASWVDGNTIRFKASESGTYTAYFTTDITEELTFDNWKFQYEKSNDNILLTKAIQGSGKLTIPAKVNDCSIIGIKASALAQQKELTSVSIPASVYTLGSAENVSAYTYIGSGVQNDVVKLNETLKDGATWSIHIDVTTTNGASLNQWGSGLLSTGDNALAENYSKGFQFYQSADGSLIIKTGSDWEKKTFNCTKGHSTYHVDLVHTADNNITFYVNNGTDTETYKLDNHSLNDINQLCTAIPSGINLASITVISPKSTPYRNKLGDIDGEQKENNAIALNQTLDAKSDWGIRFKVENSGATFNQWGSSLLATGSSPLAASYYQGFQFYLAKNGNVILKRGDHETTYTVTQNAKNFDVTLNHTADGALSVAISNGTKTESHSFENYELGDIANFSNALPVGVNIKGLTLINPSSDPAPFRGCTALTSVNITKGNVAFKANDNVVYSQDEKTLVAYPEGKVTHCFSLPSQVSHIKECAITSAPELDRIVCTSTTPASAVSDDFANATYYMQVPSTAIATYRQAWDAPMVHAIAANAVMSESDATQVADNDAVDFSATSASTATAPTLDATKQIWLTTLVNATDGYMPITFPTIPTRLTVEGLSVSETPVSSLKLYAWNGTSFQKLSGSPVAGSYLMAVPEAWNGKQITLRFANANVAQSDVKGFFGNASTQSASTDKAYYTYNAKTNLFTLHEAEEGGKVLYPFSATMIATDGLDAVFGGPGYVGNTAIKSSAQWGTYFTDQTFVMPEGLTGCIIDGVESSKLHCNATYPSGSIVPASVALLVYGELGTYYLFAPAEGSDEASAPTTNYLKGTTTDHMIQAETNHVYYQLSYGTIEGERKFGFFFGTQNGGAFVNKAHKAYLDLTTDMADMVQGFSLPMNFSTGINDIVVSNTKPLDIYTISGLKVNAKNAESLPAGVYIINGKKKIIK